MIPVTVILPVKNEEKKIRHCLQLLKNFHQIMVIDSNSTDNTKQIALEYGAEIFDFSWNGLFPKKRNWALRNLPIKNDWVLFLDADEFITKEFIQELEKSIINSKYNGYWVRYANHFMGKQIKFGYPFKKLPLFKVGKGEYEYIQEESWSLLDMEVHEHPIVEGKVGLFKSHIIHDDYKGLEHYIAKHNQYSTWEANRFINLKTNGSTQLTGKQKLKYKLLRAGILSWAYFFGSYFLRLGFLDGKAGYYCAKFKAHYFFQIKVKIEELESK